MAAATNKTKTDLFPMRAGIVRVIPLDPNGVKLYNLAYTTKREFLVSTAVTSAITTETVGNGNGQDGDYPTEDVTNIAVSTNVYDPMFHAIIAGSKKLEKLRPQLTDTTIVPKAVTDVSAVAQITFATEEKPIKVDGTTAWIELRDAYGNQLTQLTETKAASELQVGEFLYDADTGKLTLEKSYVDKELSCVYYKEASANGIAYESEPTPKIKMFNIQIMGEMVSASSGEIEYYQSEITRAIVSGDLPNVTTQKSKQNTITYNFKSAPVPEGIAPFYQHHAPKVETKQLP